MGTRWRRAARTPRGSAAARHGSRSGTARGDDAAVRVRTARRPRAPK